MQQTSHGGVFFILKMFCEFCYNQNIGTQNPAYYTDMYQRN